MRSINPDDYVFLPGPGLETLHRISRALRPSWGGACRHPPRETGRLRGKLARAGGEYGGALPSEQLRSAVPTCFRHGTQLLHVYICNTDGLHGCFAPWGVAPVATESGQTVRERSVHPTPTESHGTTIRRRTSTGGFSRKFPGLSVMGRSPRGWPDRTTRRGTWVSRTLCTLSRRSSHISRSNPW